MMSILDDYPFAGLSSDYIEGLREGVRLAEAEAKQRIYILELALNWAESSRDSFEKAVEIEGTRAEKAEAERDALLVDLKTMSAAWKKSSEAAEALLKRAQMLVEQFYGNAALNERAAAHLNRDDYSRWQGHGRASGWRQAAILLRKALIEDPKKPSWPTRCDTAPEMQEMVGGTGIEPVTPRV